MLESSREDVGRLWCTAPQRTKNRHEDIVMLSSSGLAVLLRRLSCVFHRRVPPSQWIFKTEGCRPLGWKGFL